MSRRSRFTRGSAARIRREGADPETVRFLTPPPEPKHANGRPTKTADPGPYIDEDPPVTDIVDPPVPGPDHANPAPPGSNGHRVLPDAPEKADVPRRERERRPIKPDWWSDPVGHIWWELGNAANVTGFHTLRVPWYCLRLAACAPRGVLRLYEGLWHYGRHTRARDAFEDDLIDKKNYKDYAHLEAVARRKALTATAAGLMAPPAAFAVAAAMDPLMRWPALVAAIEGLGWVGRPRDRAVIPSAVVASPTYKKITPDMVLVALSRAGLCKQNENPADMFEFQVPGVHRDGPGWAAIIDLPHGRTAEEAIKAREKIAAGLRVSQFRLFVDPVHGERGHAGQIRLWIADKDPYAQKPVLSPLLGAKRWDIFEPVPFGLNERGDLIKVPMMWTSFLIGSLARMGKSNAARILVTAAALDPHVRHIIWDGKGGKDWAPYEAIAHEMGIGPDDDVAKALRDCLRRQVADMRRRFKVIRTLDHVICPEGKITPGMHRNRDLDMPVTLITIDEFQLYAEHKKYGDEIVELLTTLAKVGPAAGFILLLATQRPGGDVIKTDFRDVLGTRFALRVTTREFSEMVLGSGAYRQGLDASRFLQTHKGIGILLGTDDGELTERGGQTVRTHLVELEDVDKVLKRARDLREGSGTLTGVAAGEDPALSIRVLDHVVQAFRGDPQMHSDRLVRNMVEDHPGIYGVQDYDVNDLVSDMRRFGIKVGNQIWARKLERNEDTGEVFDGEMGNRRGFERQLIIDAIALRTIVPDSPDQGGDED